MPFPTALSAGHLNLLRTGTFGVTQRLLVWDNEIIFQAQINQATFASSFATITYDNVTVGAYTDLKSDYVCYVSSTAGDIRTPNHVFRIRANGSGVVATATAIYINETSAALTDDWYIMVVKDVRVTAKLPRTIQGATSPLDDFRADYEISYRALRPIVYGLQSVYVGVLDSSGVYDLALAPSALVTDANAASISTWAWFIDGVAFQSGGAATQNITARFSSAGCYLLRVTATDDDGNSNYLTIHVFIVAADYSAGINLAFDAAQITADTANGWMCTMAADVASRDSVLTRIDTIPDNTFCAIWWETNQPVLTSDIMFCGRFRKENVIHGLDPQAANVFSTSFTIEGAASQLGRVQSRRLPILDDATPTAWGEIKTLTVWRAVVYFLTEYTTFTNCHALTFDSTSADFRFNRFGTDITALDSLLSILFTIDAAPNYAPTGEVHITRQAWYLPNAGRNALTTIADWTLADMAVGRGGGQLFAVGRDYARPVGRDMAGGGVYDTTTSDVQVMRALTPSVTQADGHEMATFNRQILITNSTLADAFDELGQRNADDLEARQPQIYIDTAFPTAYRMAILPHVALWHTFTITIEDTNRGILYTTSDRWTCESISLGLNPQFGAVVLTARFRLESQGAGFQTIVALPPSAAPAYYNPIVPTAPTYASFPEDDNLSQADPANPEEPIYSPVDQGLVSSPTDPSVVVNNAQTFGLFGMVWDDDNLWSVDKIPTLPVYKKLTPTSLTGTYTIRDGKFDWQSNRAWCLSDNATDSKVWKTNSFGDLAWTDADANGLYLMLRPTNDPGELFIYNAAGNDTGTDPWTWTFDFRTSSGSEPNTTYGLGGWTEDYGTWAVGGVQTEDATFGAPLIDRRRIMVSKSIAATTLTGISFTFDLTKGTYDPTSALALEIGIDAAAIQSAASTEVSSGSGQTYAWTGSDPGSTSLYVIINSSRVPNPGGFSGAALLLTITVTGTGTNPFANSGALTRRSTDYGVTFESEIAAGTSPGATGGFDTGPGGDYVYTAVDTKVVYTTDGGAYGDLTGGGTAGTYPICIVGYASPADKILMASAAAVGGETLWLVTGGTPTARTPNDGANDGLAVGPNAVHLPMRTSEIILGLFSYAGTVKFSYSADAGVTWQHNTQVSNSAIYIRGKVVNDKTAIMICDGSTLWYCLWDNSSAITLLAKGTPSTALKGVEVR